MITTPIRATDEVVVPLPPGEVWRVLADVGGYSRWWPRSLGLRVLSGGATLIGTELELRPFGGRPFRCRVEAVEEPRRMRVRYSGGFVEGCGEWRLEPLGGGTRVIYDLDVRVAGRLVAFLARLIPLGRLHSRPMRGVLQNLERVLGATESVASEGQ